MILPQGFPWLVLVVLCVFSNVLNALDLSKRLKPRGPLGVALDFSLASAWPPSNLNNPQARRNFMWSSHITFASSVGTISDKQLWQIARDAYDEIAADLTQYGTSKKNSPTVMTVLAYGKEIILATSQRGQTSYSYNYELSPVLDNLKLCQTVWRDDGPSDGETDVAHKNEGKCGEVMAAHLYYSTTTTPLAQQHARMGTVYAQKGGVLVNLDPCGDPQRDIWGCNIFVAAEGLTILDASLNPEPYTLSTLAGGPVSIDQVQLCSVLKAAGPS